MEVSFIRVILLCSSSYMKNAGFNSKLKYLVALFFWKLIHYFKTISLSGKEELPRINSVDSILFSNCVTGLLLSINCNNNSVASFPISNAGWRTTVNDGFNNSALFELENPTNAMSSGTFIPRLINVLKQPVVNLSAIVMMASGFCFSVIN